MTTFYTSDLHFGHRNIMRYCPQRAVYLGVTNVDFENPTDQNVSDMNEALVRNWNEQVGPDDSVLVIGDVAMGKVENNIEYIRALNGTKHLVLGNHDKPHPICTKDDVKQARWEGVYRDAGFVTFAFTLDATIGGVPVIINHFPYYGDHTMDRYNADIIAEFIPNDKGMPLVHGHVHDMWQTRDGKMYNVGIDAWAGMFRTEQDIASYFRANGFGS